MYLNKTIIIGNITREIELKALPSGIKVASFSVATNRSYKDKDGNKKEEVEFHNVVAFGKQAETVEKWFKKGSQILVEGRLQTRNWEADGHKNYRTEIMLENFGFGNSTKDDKPKEKTATETKTVEYPDDAIDPQSIPF